MAVYEGVLESGDSSLYPKNVDRFGDGRPTLRQITGVRGGRTRGEKPTFIAVKACRSAVMKTFCFSPVASQAV